MVYHLKVIIIGDAGVGKTSLVKKFISGHFSQDYKASIGTNLYATNLSLKSGDKVSIQVWDIAGQEKWIKMRHMYYRGTHGALIVGDLTRRNTFEQLADFWIPDLEKYCGEIPKILVANKVDLDSIISNNDIEKLAQAINVKATFFTSAKNGQNVEKAFLLIAEAIVESKT